MAAKKNRRFSGEIFDIGFLLIIGNAKIAEFPL